MRTKKLQFLKIECRGPVYVHAIRENSGNAVKRKETRPGLLDVCLDPQHHAVSADVEIGGIGDLDCIWREIGKRKKEKTSKWCFFYISQKKDAFPSPCFYSESDRVYMCSLPSCRTHQV